MERDELEFDIVCVGCGIASLSTILRLMNRVEAGGRGSSPSVLMIDKSATAGSHILSGTVIDPSSFVELLGVSGAALLPVNAFVSSESYRFLLRDSSVKLPWVPQAMHAKGFQIVSLSDVSRHLASLCEKAGVEVFTGFAAVELLRDGSRITGVRLGDRGVDKHGQKRSNYMPGADIKAGVVVLGEGACGFLTEQLLESDGMRGANPQSYAIGIKEVFDVPGRKGSAGTIMHSFGYPLGHSTYGGGFVYCLSDTQVAAGLITALDYDNPSLNPHDMFRLFKQHPDVQRFIAGGTVAGYGAKIIPEGGFNAIPQLVADGAIIVGDAAGLLDTVRLKGAHLAVQSGIAAGDALFECWKAGDFSKNSLMRYPAAMKESAGWRQLREIRNMRASFKYGLIPGVMGTGLSVMTGGILPPGRISMKPDRASMKRKSLFAKAAVPFRPQEKQEALQLDRLSDLYLSGTRHEENQPTHLKIRNHGKCAECIRDFGAPCTLFCPAQVYNLREDGQGISVDASNCLHCRTCQIKDPFENIFWTPPEAGGPDYKGM